MTSCLVVGGTGFVGRRVTDALVQRGYSVDVLTRGLTGTPKGVREHLKADRNDALKVKAALEGKNYDYIFDINGMNEAHVKHITSAIDSRNLKGYIFCSSAAVHLDSPNFKDEESPTGENPTWGKYGLDKLHAENHLFAWGRKTGVPITAFRPSYIYGPGNNLRREAHFFERIARGLPIPVPGDGKTRIQLVFVDDVAATMAGVVEHGVHSSGAYNLTNPEPISFADFIGLAGKAVGKKPAIVKVPQSFISNKELKVRSFFPFRDVTFLQKTDKLKESGLPVPATPNKEGLRRAYEWYRQIHPTVVDPTMDKIDVVIKGAKECKAKR